MTMTRIHESDDDDETEFRTGKIDGAICEMSALAVLFRKGTPQGVADRVTATLRALDTDPLNYAALLDGASGCAFCGRALTDEVSKLVGVGPDCARRYCIPHSMAAASVRLALRRKLLGEAA